MGWDIHMNFSMMDFTVMRWSHHSVISCGDTIILFFYWQGWAITGILHWWDKTFTWIFPWCDYTITWIHLRWGWIIMFPSVMGLDYHMNLSLMRLDHHKRYSLMGWGIHMNSYLMKLYHPSHQFSVDGVGTQQFLHRWGWIIHLRLMRWSQYSWKWWYYHTKFSQME